MNYSLKKIGTVEACDTLLASAQKRKESLQRKRRNLGESIIRFNERISNVSNELILVQVLLETYTTAYNILPQGSQYKVNINIKVKRLEVRKARLEKRSITYNVYSLLRKQVDYNRLDTGVSVIGSYIAAVQRKRTVLSNTLRYLAEQRRTGKSLYSSYEHFSNSAIDTTKAVSCLGSSHQRVFRHTFIPHQSYVCLQLLCFLPQYTHRSSGGIPTNYLAKT